MTEEERAYNLEDFSTAAPAPTNPGETMAAKIGVLAPDFQAADLNRGVVHLAEFRGKRHVVLMTGAVTSPMCAFEIPEFNQLHAEFHSKDISFFLLYTRESHPAENYSAHRSFEQKLAYARDLQRLESVNFPILVDYLDGRIHRAYGVWPNALFVIHKDGRLIFRSNMANHRELREFLNDLLRAENARGQDKVTHLQYSERLLPHEADQATHHRIYERAGSTAFEEYWVKRPQHRNRWP
jgi:peroxiredoxin